MKQEIIRGRTYLFGDNINTDFINPAQYMELPMDQMIQHAMEGADPDFSKNVRPGDVMVAGINFGSGSSRETAPMVIKGSGISVLIAVSFARIFYRTSWRWTPSPGPSGISPPGRTTPAPHCRRTFWNWSMTAVSSLIWKRL